MMLGMKKEQLTRNSKQLLGWLLAVSCLLLTIPTSGVQAQAGDGCGTTDLTPAQQTAVGNIQRADPENDPATMSCQNVAGVSRDTRSSRCISGACPGGADTMCCLPGIGASRGRVPEAPTEPAVERADRGGALRLQLPDCTRTGDCGLDDLVQMGVNFANFLFGISGAIFLAIFVYAGFKYIFFASNASEAASSKGMLVNATIGIILMFGASALVTTVYNSFRTGGSGGSERCAAAYPTFSCQALTANREDTDARSAEVTSRGCHPGLCGERNLLVCCPASGGTP